MSGYYRYIDQNLRDSIFGLIRTGINEKTKDTIKYFSNLRKFQVVSEGGVMLLEGQTRGHSCTTKADGFWTSRYRNGRLKEQGRYQLNEKIGTWMYYHKTGELKKIENYGRPYSTDLSEHRLNQIFKVGELYLDNKALINGPFKEYYPNGQIKTEGQYELVEKFSTIDTVFTFNPETYEKIPNLIEGEFWNPVVIRTGVWNYYHENGNLEKTENIQYPYYDESIRRIKVRYRELFEAVYKIGKEE